MARAKAMKQMLLELQLCKMIEQQQQVSKQSKRGRADQLKAQSTGAFIDAGVML